MMKIELAGRVGDDCYSAWMIWQKLPDCTESGGRHYYKYPLDIARDGYYAMYREQPSKPSVLR